MRPVSSLSEIRAEWAWRIGPVMRCVRPMVTKSMGYQSRSLFLNPVVVSSRLFLKKSVLKGRGFQPCRKSRKFDLGFKRWGMLPSERRVSSANCLAGTRFK